MSLKCPKCSENKGIIQLVDDRYKYFKCLSCGDMFPMKNYSYLMKEVEELENNLVIEEIKF